MVQIITLGFLWNRSYGHQRGLTLYFLLSLSGSRASRWVEKVIKLEEASAPIL